MYFLSRIGLLLLMLILSAATGETKWEELTNCLFLRVLKTNLLHYLAD